MNAGLDGDFREALLGASCMSGTPAATMRAMNSSGSIVSEVAFTVSTNDAAEYCTAALTLTRKTTDGRARTPGHRQLDARQSSRPLCRHKAGGHCAHTGCCMAREAVKHRGHTSCVKK